jgi:RNA polymerase sigma factor FliA
MQGIGDSKAPDTRARDERIKAHLELVKSMAGDIRARPLGRGMEVDDLIAYGAIGLVEAATRFEERGVPFSAFARLRIYGAIVDGIRAQHWFGRRADRRLRIDRVGHDWQVALAAGHHAQNDVRRNGRPMVCPPAEMEDVAGQVAVALRSLPALERRVVELHHYEEKTITQAAKELRIGRPRASRLHARALVTLRAVIENPTSYPYRPEAHETERSRRADLDAVRPSS